MGRPGALLAVLASVIVGCGAPAASGSGAATGTAPPATVFPAASSAATTPGARATAALPTPLPSGIPVYLDDKSRDLHVVEKKREQRGAATVLDLQWVGDWGDTMRAYLVLPAGTGPSPAVIYLHWLSNDATANRSEFLDEGIALAGNGVASFHIQGRFPWVTSPSGADADRAGILGQLIDLRRVVDYLANRPEIDRSRLAIVGHDFGAMYAALLAGLDDRLQTAVIMAGAPHWADWFVKYWRPLGSMSEADYRARLADIDPVVLLAGVAPRPVLLQWATQDLFVDGAHRDEFVAASETATSKIYDAQHKLDDPVAIADRDDWLIQQLQPGGN